MGGGSPLAWCTQLLLAPDSHDSQQASTFWAQVMISDPRWRATAAPMTRSPMRLSGAETSRLKFPSAGKERVPLEMVTTFHSSRRIWI